MCKFRILQTRNRAYTAAKWRASTAVWWAARCLWDGGSRIGGRVVLSSVLGFILLRMTLERNPSGVLAYSTGEQGFRYIDFRREGKHNTIVYSGFSHRCLWQCSDSILIGNFPVQEAPPIRVLAVGRFVSPTAPSGKPSLGTCSFELLRCEDLDLGLLSFRSPAPTKSLMLISGAGCCCFDVPFAPPRVPAPFFGPIVPTGVKLARVLEVAGFAVLHFEPGLRIFF